MGIHKALFTGVSLTRSWKPRNQSWGVFLSVAAGRNECELLQSSWLELPGILAGTQGKSNCWHFIHLLGKLELCSIENVCYRGVFLLVCWRVGIGWGEGKLTLLSFPSSKPGVKFHLASFPDLGPSRTHSDPACIQEAELSRAPLAATHAYRGGNGPLSHSLLAELWLPLLWGQYLSSSHFIQTTVLFSRHSMRQQEQDPSKTKTSPTTARQWIGLRENNFAKSCICTQSWVTFGDKVVFKVGVDKPPKFIPWEHLKSLKS